VAAFWARYWAYDVGGVQSWFERWNRGDRDFSTDELHPDFQIISRVETGAERLDDIESLWETMHEYHAGVVGEARKVAPFRRGGLLAPPPR
jgi:hypothetical protein